MRSELNVTVIGLGKIGLPLAVQFARSGFQVFGVDVNERVVNQVNLGEEPFPGEKNLEEYLKEVVRDGRLTATCETKLAVSQSQVIVVVVPLYVDTEGIPDFQSIDQATSQIGLAIEPGTLVSYETTLPVGTTRDRFAKKIEETSGLVAGRSFHVVFSPERVLTGRVFEDLMKYPKLVGGIDPLSEQRGVEFYSKALQFIKRPDLPRENGVWPMGGCEAAELAKLAETTYRDVNIALVNHFAIFAESHAINIDEVIDACNSQPYSHLHKPGIAVGGHCIPVYPQMYLLNDPEASVIIAARKTNIEMPRKVVHLLERIHGSLSNQVILIIGITYRGGVKETYNSGVFPLRNKLEACQAKVFVTDPMFSEEEIRNLGLTPYVAGTAIDAAIIQADHKEFESLRVEDFPGIRTVLDGRRVLNPKNWVGTNFHFLGQGK